MRNLAFALALTSLGVLACGRNADSNDRPSTVTPAPSSASVATSPTPEELGTLGAQIKKNPKDSDRLLRQRGMTEQQFESAIRRTAEDPKASKRYAAAFHKAGA